MFKFFQSSAWQVTDEDKKNGITIQQCVSEVSGVPALKSTSILPFPIMQIFATLHDSRYRPIYDSNIEAASVLQKVAANTYYIYQKTKSILVVSSRDLVLAHHVAHIQHPEVCPKGGLLIMAFTPDPRMDSLKPESKQAVRAHCHVSTFSLELLRYLDVLTIQFLILCRLVAGFSRRSVRVKQKQP